MATENVNGVRLRYELTGAGEAPLVLVHGSWGAHDNWDLVVPALGASFRVLTYDRRGHGESECPPGQGSVREDVADLAALIESLGLAPAWVAGNSFGATITLRLAGERPDLLRGVIAHEPPAFQLLTDDPAAASLLSEMGPRMASVAERIASGDHSGAAEEFMGTVLAAGEWDQLTPEFRNAAVENAPTFLDETKDPEGLDFDLEWIKGFTRPVLLTDGDRSPPMFAAVLAKLADALPQAERLTFPGLGHIPHATDPAVYVEAVATFIGKHEGS